MILFWAYDFFIIFLYIYSKACDKGLKEDVEYYIIDIEKKNESGDTPLIIGL